MNVVKDGKEETRIKCELEKMEVEPTAALNKLNEIVRQKGMKIYSAKYNYDDRLVNVIRFRITHSGGYNSDVVDSIRNVLDETGTLSSINVSQNKTWEWSSDEE